MKSNLIILFIFIVFLQSCGLNEREKNLQILQKEIAQKEQGLLAWEQRLKLKEEALEHARQSLDSAKMQADSASVYDPAIVGKWIVKMSCIETTCDGSALGDTKTEQWDISYNQKSIVVKAYSGPVLIRVYVGNYRDNQLKVLDERPNVDVSFKAALNFINEKRMDGTREILQANCKIVYALTAEKSK
ncbi:hypothetical protein [Pedobacter psychroterrae]|uniref:Uncharacterized protein n=1 Tax=Pedobacter psychroterrae TaxID=2530453 RepID=A0A4R0NFK1_9SPHI|nr:hypothetical protein [Pedobacter psychroterrae]TCC97424.1 hypothetical protein EZ437_20265 [Pedobacter psychroterrae]